MSKISELSDGGVIQGGDTLIAVRSGGNVKVTYGGSTTANIDGGTIDGTVIGGSTAAAGTFTTGQFNTSLNVDGTTNLDVVDIDGAVDMASTLTVGGTTNDGTSLVQIAQSGTGRAFSVNRNVASATRAVVNIAQLQASGGAEAVLDIQQTTPASRAIKVTPDGSIDRFSVYGTGALVTTPVAGGHAVFNEGGVDADFRVESDTNTHALFVEGSSSNVGIGTSSLTEKLTVVGTTKVGEGVASNTSKLMVNTASGTAAGIQLFQDGVESWIIQNPASTTALTFANSGSERLRITATGNVGIGNSNPSNYNAVGSNRLVVGTNVGNNGITIVGATTGFSSLAFADSAGSGGNDDYAGLIQYSHITNNMNFFTNSTQKMVLDSSGNVGIGTSSPTGKFHVVGGRSNFAPNSENFAVYLQYNSATSGFYVGSPSADAMAFSASSGAERMRIDASGNLILGGTTAITDTGTPSLTLGNGAGNPSLNFYGTSAGQAGQISFGDATSGTGAYEGYLLYDNANNFMAFGTNHTERMRIDSSGSVGIGANSPTTSLTLGTGTTGVSFQSGSLALNSGKIAVIKPIEVGTGNGHLVFETYEGGSGGGERMRLDSSGNLLVGRSSAGAAATDNGHVFYGSGQHYIFSNATECVRFYETSGSGQQVGSISITSSATAFNTSSDQRLKENITDANDAGDKIDAIKVRQYDWKADGSHQDYGMVAQELMTVAPEAVSGDTESDEMMGVDYSKLVPMMLKEIQSLRARVAQLEGAN